MRERKRNRIANKEFKKVKINGRKINKNFNKTRKERSEKRKIKDLLTVADALGREIR